MTAESNEEHPFATILGMILMVLCGVGMYTTTIKSRKKEPEPNQAAQALVETPAPSLPDIQRLANLNYFRMLRDCHKTFSEVLNPEDSLSDPLSAIETIDDLTGTIATADVRDVDDELQTIASDYAEVLLSFRRSFKEINRFQSPDELLRVFLEGFARGANGGGPEVVIEGFARYKHILDNLEASYNAMRTVTFRADRRANQLGLLRPAGE